MSQITRRSFVTTAATGAAVLGAAAASTTARAAEAPATFADTVAWGYEADVVIVGLGGAGAAAAITAAQAGAKTLVVEKAPEGLDGGNTKFCSQRFLRIDPENRDKMVEYMKAVRGLFTEDMSDEVIDYLVDGYLRTADWYESVGGYVGDPRVDPEYPDFVNSDVVVKNWTAKDYQGAFWPTMLRNIQQLREEGKIEVWHASPATKLIQDPISRTVIGVTVSKDGDAEVNVRARNGVLLACGGFEANNQMVQNYVDMPTCVPLGTQYNTGDGIKMAQAVGADLWHMSATSGPFFEFQDPDTKVCYRQLTGTVSYASLKDSAAIMVGADGTRFVSETVKLKHGHVMFHGLYIRVPSSFPIYVVFDEASRLTKPFYRVWSEGMVDEIEKGWITKADTIEELAEAINVPADKLAKQVEDYNGYCEAGEDPLGREADYLFPFGEGPYYAFPVVPCFINTQGGPVRNTSCQVLDTNREPIPGLYSAGELGSFYSSLYQGAGNVAECIMTGIDAVTTMLKNPADAAPLQFAVAEQPAQVTDEPYEAPTYETGEGQYVADGDGMGVVTVRVTMDGERIEDVEVLGGSETPRIGELAIERIPQAIVDAQSTEVDVVAGATRTSDGIIAAVNKAVAEAK
ncbi:FAD-binding protein [bacterium]|nr:FAD-binding protein [bacterium]